MKSHILVAMLFILLLIPTAVHQASAMGRMRTSNACEVDANNFCLGVLEQGHDSLVSCLKLHASEISCECKEAIGIPQH